MLFITIASGAQLTAIPVAQDMTEGIMARFRTMSISRSAVLGGHVWSAVIQNVVGLIIVIVVSMLMGYRPGAGMMDWLLLAGFLLLAVISITWLSLTCGLVTDSVEAASNLPMPLMLLPFFGSGLVPTDSMPPALAWFAEHQPFTPMIETTRALLTGAAVGSEGLVAVAWCIAIGVFGYVASIRLYERKSVG
jgi:ABC-2 type transport system permease protein